MTPKEFSESIGIEHKEHYPGLECPNCNKWGVEIDNDTATGKCPHCGEEFTEDDVCGECGKLVKGSCFYCKMD